MGPFNFEELKGKNLSRETLIWFEGMERWQKADTIDALKILFKALPPPLPTIALTPPPLPLPQKGEKEYIQTNITEENEYRKILGIKRTFFIYGAAAVILILGISAFNSYKNTEIEEQKHELYDQQLDEQKAEIEQQNARIAEQERLEKERIEREKRIARENRVKEITGQLTANYQNLEKAKKDLHNVSAFKLLRTSSERHEQISEAEANVSYWQNEINLLETEMKNLQ